MIEQPRRQRHAPGIVLVRDIAGVTAATALGIALVKRVRDLVLGVPALLSWHVAESRARKAATAAPPEP